MGKHDDGEIPVSLDDLNAFLATNTWKALQRAIRERLTMCRNLLGALSSEEKVLRFAQGQQEEDEYVLSFPQWLKQEIKENEQYESERRNNES